MMSESAVARPTGATEVPEPPMALPGGLVSLADWRLPPASVRHTVRDLLSSTWGQFRHRFDPGEHGFRPEPDIETLTSLQLRRFAPDPDRTAQVQALGAEIDRQQAQTRDGVLALVTPPCSGLRETLVTLAEERGWRVIQPPEVWPASQAEAENWWQQQALDEPWLIADLAGLWRRHRRGLWLLKAFFQGLALGRFGAGVVHCSSWCWGFWQRYLPQLPVASCTPAALDEPLLAAWLGSLVGRESGLTVRMSDSGDAVLPLESERNGSRRHRLIRDLAAFARGNPGVALAIWRKLLRARPEAPEADTDKPATGARGCWAIPLEQLSLPAVPSSPDRGATLILHALLLHDGLSLGELPAVTGLGSDAVAILLQTLRNGELVAEGERGWQVTALGYPAVRRQLLNDGYPVDGF